MYIYIYQCIYIYATFGRTICTQPCPEPKSRCLLFLWPWYVVINLPSSPLHRSEKKSNDGRVPPIPGSPPPPHLPFRQLAVDVLDGLITRSRFLRRAHTGLTWWHGKAWNCQQVTELKLRLLEGYQFVEKWRCFVLSGSRLIWVIFRTYIMRAKKSCDTCLVHLLSKHHARRIWHCFISQGYSTKKPKKNSARHCIMKNTKNKFQGNNIQGTYSHYSFQKNIAPEIVCVHVFSEYGAVSLIFP